MRSVDAVRVPVRPVPSDDGKHQKGSRGHTEAREMPYAFGEPMTLECGNCSTHCYRRVLISPRG